MKVDYDNGRSESIFPPVFVRPRHPAPWQEDPSLVSPATTMSQRFTVSKSDGDRRPSDIQGEVNQLFEGDEPTTSSGAEGEDAAGPEVVVVLKGRETLTPASFIPFVSYRLYASCADACLLFGDTTLSTDRCV